MYIKEVTIKNFRNFKNIKIPLNRFTILIGENDIGKSNLIKAIRLVLNNNTFEYSSRTLGITDFNNKKMQEFKLTINEKKEEVKKAIEDNDEKYINNLIPIIEIELTFVEAKDSYQKALLSDWLDEDKEGECYKVKYVYEPKDKIKFLKEILEISELGNEYMIPLDKYEYRIISANNGKGIRFDKFKNFNISYIGAERDNFSENEKQNSYRLISSLLEKNLETKDRYQANKAYDEFFDKLKELKSFRKVFEKFDNSDFDNWRDIIEKLELGPNTPNLKSIFSNINMVYGDEFLYQKGLGKRNLLLIILLFTNYIITDRKFNFLVVEGPEAHMCINNLNIAIDFISKSAEKIEENSFNQILITTHNYNIINKLKFENVVLLKETEAINFSEYKEESKYLAKRPNFDILKILLAKRVILVEGTTEEMLINTYLQKNEKDLNMAEVIVTGKGFKRFLDIWKLINSNTDKKIGIVRDYDNQLNAKEEHEEYDDDKNIFVRTTEKYTLEDDLVNQGNNKEELEKIFKDELGKVEITEYLKSNKAEAMYKICNEILDNNANIELPKHIKEIIDKVCVKAKYKSQEQELEKHMD